MKLTQDHYRAAKQIINQISGDQPVIDKYLDDRIKETQPKIIFECIKSSWPFERYREGFSYPENQLAFADYPLNFKLQVPEGPITMDGVCKRLDEMLEGFLMRLYFGPSYRIKK